MTALDGTNLNPLDCTDINFQLSRKRGNKILRGISVPNKTSDAGSQFSAEMNHCIAKGYLNL
jgi:hypothetical protein